MSFTTDHRVSNSKPVKADADMDIFIANAEDLLSKVGVLSLCRASISQSVPNNTTTVGTFTNPAILDTDSYFNNGSPTRLTIPSGIYHCQIVLNYRVHTSGVSAGDIYLQKNGASFAGAPGHNIYGLLEGSIRTPILAVTPGDYFTVLFYQNSGGTVTSRAEAVIQGWKS